MNPRAVAALCVIGASVTALPGCGGSTSAVGTKSPPEATARDAKLDECISQWNADDTEHSIAQGFASQSASDARVGLFTGGECGVSMSGTEDWTAAYGVYAPDQFGPWFHSAQSASDRPEQSAVEQLAELSREAAANPNATILADGSLRAIPGAHVANFGVPRDIPMVNGLTGATAPATSSYTIDAATWNQYSSDQKAGVLADYTAEQSCPLARGKEIAAAIANGTFAIQSDSVESTLAAWCSGPAAGGANSGQTGSASSGQSASAGATGGSATPCPGSTAYGQPIDLVATGASCTTAHLLTQGVEPCAMQQPSVGCSVDAGGATWSCSYKFEGQNFEDYTCHQGQAQVRWRVGID